MKTNKIEPSFQRLKIGKIPAYCIAHLPTYKEMEKLTDKADVFIKICEKDFEYKGDRIQKINVPALKISARPLNLGFFEKLFNKKTVTEYFPVGNMRVSVVYDDNKTITDVISDVVSKVK